VRLLSSLKTNSPPKNREEEAGKAKERARRGLGIENQLGEPTPEIRPLRLAQAMGTWEVSVGVDRTRSGTGCAS
jgi:hypothetical protein